MCTNNNLTRSHADTVGEKHSSATHRMSSSNYAADILGEDFVFECVILATNFLSSKAVRISGKILEFFQKRKSSLIHRSFVRVCCVNIFWSLPRFTSKRKFKGLPIF